MEWLDAMRGIAMLMVIYTHQVLGSGLEKMEGTVYVFGLFMLPMFFFISGFLSVSNTRIPFNTKVLRLSRQLLLPTIVVYVFHSIVYGYSVDLYDQMKGGYWFLPTLFIMELIAFIIFERLRAVSLKWKILLIVILIVGDKLIMSLSFRYGLLGHPLSKAFQIPLFLTFLIPFLFGALIRYIEKPFFSFMISSCYGFGILICLFIILYSLPFSLVGVFMVSIGTLIIFLAMRGGAAYFSYNSSHISRFLIVCGKNTLGLYLLHYFVLQSVICHFAPRLLLYLNMADNPLMQLIIMGIATISTTLITLLGIRVIEQSPMLSLLCLGQPMRKRKQ